MSSSQSQPTDHRSWWRALRATGWLLLAVVALAVIFCVTALFSLLFLFGAG